MTARQVPAFARSMPQGLSDAQFLSIAWSRGLKPARRRAIALQHYRNRKEATRANT